MLEIQRFLILSYVYNIWSGFNLRIDLMQAGLTWQRLLNLAWLAMMNSSRTSSCIMALAQSANAEASILSFSCPIPILPTYCLLLLIDISLRLSPNRPCMTLVILILVVCPSVRYGTSVEVIDPATKEAISLALEH
jgi:hypothetical protein